MSIADKNIIDDKLPLFDCPAVSDSEKQEMQAQLYRQIRANTKVLHLLHNLILDPLEQILERMSAVEYIFLIQYCRRQ